MESISIFDIFKIGIGPSSSHTLGPWKAARKFVGQLNESDLDHIQVHLYGSLSKTGVGHATDKAIVLGLMELEPETIDPDTIDATIKAVIDKGEITIKSKTIPFDFKLDIIFEEVVHPLHPNTLKFTAFSKDKVVTEEVYASVGGGFIESQNAEAPINKPISLPYPIKTGEELLSYTREQDCNISDIVFKNESSIRSKEEIDLQIEKLLDTILDSIFRGCSTGGNLPGGLCVVRRAKSICDKLLDGKVYTDRGLWLDAIRKTPKDYNAVNKWISCFALAVNEENAAMGRIVTSPTNGAAGVIPAVIMYYALFCDYQGKESIKRFLFTAGEVGCLFKKGATISAAVGGCQAEIGVSSAMAAAGLTEVLGGTPEQCLMAAEIAMEHHLGLTCDPVKGLVQIPCIERNTMGAVKAITAANLAFEGKPWEAKVSLDVAIKTMWEVAKNMNTKYKETAEGGLAINLPVINPNC